MSFELLVRNCAPTLAGLKAGSIFPQHGTKEELEETVMLLDQTIKNKGVRARLLYKKDKGPSLVYVYREHSIEKIIKDSDVQSFLSEYGYTRFSIPSCLDYLEQRLSQDDFPHEIGIFLDYPLSDIRAFIKNKGKNCPCTGYWKAYTNIPEAKRKFRQFKKCTVVYCKQISSEADIIRLTVAG